MVADQLMDPKLNKTNQRQWLISELVKRKEYTDAYMAELEKYKVNNKVEKKSRMSFIDGLKKFWKNGFPCFTGSN